MEISAKLIALLKDYEKFSSKPYAASDAEKKRGIWTIGYGMTIWPNGRRVTAFDAPLSEIAASNYLTERLKQYEAAATSILRVKLTQNEFDAIVMWMYNCFSIASMQKAAQTTLMKTLNVGNKAEASQEFDKWVYQNKVKMPGLVARREDEKEMFLFADYQRGSGTLKSSSKVTPKASTKS